MGPNRSPCSITEMSSTRRRLLNTATAIDALLKSRPAQALDVLCQRIKPKKRCWGAPAGRWHRRSSWRRERPQLSLPGRTSDRSAQVLSGRASPMADPVERWSQGLTRGRARAKETKLTIRETTSEKRGEQKKEKATGCEQGGSCSCRSAQTMRVQYPLIP